MKMNLPKRRRFWRNPKFWASLAALLFVVGFAHWLWQPGLQIRDGRDDLGRNALWISHGWLGADSWFDADNPGEKTRFRAVANIEKMAQLCRDNAIRDLYPHLTPTQPDGAMSGYNDAQIERFLDNTNGLRVLPWVGGRRGTHIAPDDAAKTARFVHSVGELLRKHPRLAGVHLNVEPWKSGDAGMLKLLDDLKTALGPGKILSISGYPPQSEWYPLRLAWSRDYYHQVAARCDQIAVMLYDSSLHDAKLYQWFFARWTRTVLEWTSGPNAPEILLGVPTYGAAGPTTGPLYHDPRVENLPNTLAGLHRGLANAGRLPPNYAGAAIYCDWETDADEWKVWRRDFRAP